MDVNLALLLIRLTVGGLLAVHGAQKLFGWFGGHGIQGTGGFLSSMGFPASHAWLVGLSEFGGGLFLAVGLLTPLAAAAVAGTMLTAIAVAHWDNGLFNQNGGYEFPMTLAVVALALAFSGAGAWSLDHALGWRLGGAEWGIGMALLAALSTAVVVGTRGMRLRRDNDGSVTA